MGNPPQLNCFAAFLMVCMVVMIPCQAANYYNCPAPKLIFPCNCSQANYPYISWSAPQNNSIVIDCHNKNLTDSKISTILNKFLSSKNVSKVIQILASNNQLTKIPDQISKFPYLYYLDMASNKITEILGNKTIINRKNLQTGAIVNIDLQKNLIRSFHSGAFAFSSVRDLSFLLNLSFNKITSVPANAFNFPSAKSVEIYLGWNEISEALPEGIFNFPSVDRVEVFMGYNYNYPTNVLKPGMFNFPSATHVRINFDSCKVSAILPNTFNYPSATSFVEIWVTSNQIKTIPAGVFNVPTSPTVIVNLSFNLIETISPGIFNFPSATYVSITLARNKISVIPPNTFSQGDYAWLDLQYNQLKRVESAVFKAPLMTKITNRATYVLIGENPIDCSTDPCHLAWLFLSSNSSQMLSHVYAQNICANDVNSRPFSALSSFPFSSCPCVY